MSYFPSLNPLAQQYPTSLSNRTRRCWFLKYPLCLRTLCGTILLLKDFHSLFLVVLEAFQLGVHIKGKFLLGIPVLLVINEAEFNSLHLSPQNFLPNPT